MTCDNTSHLCLAMLHIWTTFPMCKSGLLLPHNALRRSTACSNRKVGHNVTLRRNKTITMLGQAVRRFTTSAVRSSHYAEGPGKVISVYLAHFILLIIATFSSAGLVCSHRLNVATVIWRSLVFFDKTSTVAISMIDCQVCFSFITPWNI